MWIQICIVFTGSKPVSIVRNRMLEDFGLVNRHVESINSDVVYAYFDIFATMLDYANSYVRTRAIVLIAANAKWG